MIIGIEKLFLMLIVLYFTTLLKLFEVVTNRGLGLDSQHPGGGSQQSMSSVPGEPIVMYMVQSKVFMNIK